MMMNDEDFPQPQRNDGGRPCGECHLQPGETCDVCGAIEPALAHGKETPDVASAFTAAYEAGKRDALQMNETAQCTSRAKKGGSDV